MEGFGCRGLTSGPRFAPGSPPSTGVRVSICVCGLGSGVWGSGFRAQGSSPAFGEGFRSLGDGLLLLCYLIMVYFIIIDFTYIILGIGVWGFGCWGLTSGPRFASESPPSTGVRVPTCVWGLGSGVCGLSMGVRVQGFERLLKSTLCEKSYFVKIMLAEPP